MWQWHRNAPMEHTHRNQKYQCSILTGSTSTHMASTQELHAPMWPTPRNYMHPCGILTGTTRTYVSFSQDRIFLTGQAYVRPSNPALFSTSIDRDTANIIRVSPASSKRTYDSLDPHIHRVHLTNVRHFWYWINIWCLCFIRSALRHTKPNSSSYERPYIPV